MNGGGGGSQEHSHPTPPYAAKTGQNQPSEANPRPRMTNSATTTTCGVGRGVSTLSDSKLLEDEINEEVRVILRPRKPPRPKSEVFLDQAAKRRSKRYSAFGVSKVK